MFQVNTQIITKYKFGQKNTIHSIQLQNKLYYNYVCTSLKTSSSDLFKWFNNRRTGELKPTIEPLVRYGGLKRLIALEKCKPNIYVNE